MPPVTQRIADLLGGVSQQAPHRRRPNELEESINAIHSPSRGLGKRPHTQHIGLLWGSPDPFNTSTVRVLDYGAGERYFVGFINGDLKLWNEAGSLQTVQFPNGKSYLNATKSGSIRTATIGNRTFVANREVKTLRSGADKAAAPIPQALIYVEQADYATRYEITIDGKTISYETDAGVDPGARRSISTDNITEKLASIMSDSFGGFSFTQYGSMILVKRADLNDFRISTKDGLGDNGIRAVKSKVQRSTDLPARCLDGFVLEVAGDPESAKDDYWVKFSAVGSDDFRGVWKETVRPGEARALDAATMPHELVYSDILTDELEHRGLPPLPNVNATGYIAHEPAEPFSDALNGGTDEAGEFWFLRKHDDLSGAVNMAAHVNLSEATGGPVKVKVRFRVNTTKMTPGTTLTFKIGHNSGVSGTVWTESWRATYTAGLYYDNQTAEFDIETDIGQNWDIKLWLEYSGGATPASPGEIAIYPNRQGGFINFGTSGGFVYYTTPYRVVTFGLDTVYPKGTQWTFVINGNTATYTQSADLKGTELPALLKPAIEAQIANLVIAVVFGFNLSIANTGLVGTPSVTVSATYASNTRFWNPTVTLPFTDSSLVGNTLKNLSDGSVGTINANDAHSITVNSWSGGVENKLRPGDHVIVVAPSKQFFFRQVRWAKREVGSAATNPWPSFMDDTIRDIFFHRGRFGILAGAKVVMSEAGKSENLFRTSTTELLDSDPIDVTWSGGGEARFHSAEPWNGDIVFFGDRVQVVPRGEPVLSPKTIRLELLSSYPCDPLAHPLGAGRWVFYGRPLAEASQVHALGISPRTRVAEAREVTTNIPSYLLGSPKFFAADPALNTLYVVTSGSPRYIYHLRYMLEDDAEMSLSWGRWEFTGNVLGMDVLDGKLVLVMQYPDGVYLETLDTALNPVTKDFTSYSIGQTPSGMSGGIGWRITPWQDSNVPANANPFAALGTFEATNPLGHGNPSLPQTINLDSPVGQVVITCHCPTYTGNQAKVYSANGTLLGSYNFPQSGSPASELDPAPQTTFTIPGITRIELIPSTGIAEGDYVTWDVSFSPDVSGARSLDRQVFKGSGGYNAGLNQTTWSLPYWIPVDGGAGELVVTLMDGTVLPVVARNAVDTVTVSGNYASTPVFIGIKFTFEVTLSPLYFRGADYTGIPRADSRQRTQIHRIRLLHQNTTAYDVTVKGTERAEVTYPFSAASPTSGSLKVPVLSNNEKVTIKIKNSVPKPCWITGMEWEGIFHPSVPLR